MRGSSSFLIISHLTRRNASDSVLKERHDWSTLSTLTEYIYARQSGQSSHVSEPRVVAVGGAEIAREFDPIELTTTDGCRW